MTAYPSIRALPATVRAKMPGVGTMAGCLTEVRISIATSAPFSAVQAFGATCNPPVELENNLANLGVGPQPVSVLSQLAQSDRVDHVAISCDESDLPSATVRFIAPH